MCISQFINKISLLLRFSDEVPVSESPLLIQPLLQVATICERVISEADGTVSLIRIIDRFTVGGQSEEMPAALLQFQVVVLFRSGNYRGRLELSLATHDPDMRVVSQVKFPLDFEGDAERGNNTVAAVNMQVNKEGLYWIIVSLAESECTRIPLRVVYQKQPIVLSGG